jgi:hypothetical protein
MKIGFNEEVNCGSNRFNDGFTALFADCYSWKIEG